MADKHIDDKHYWQAIAILIKNYHAVNKKIFEVLITDVQKVQHGHPYPSNMDELAQQLRTDADSKTCEGFRISFKMLTKKLSSNILANGILDFANLSYKCHFVADEGFDDFAVSLKDGKIKAYAMGQDKDVELTRGSRWAEYVLQPKLCNWSQCTKEESGQKSLGLVDVEQYNDLYKALKQKHSQQLLELWQTANESTDPLKFIYEDLAIAAYLITLWKCTQSEPNAFADLGCGNGMLVHVLNEEGYKGYGYDVRKRKLWSLYPNATNSNLLEQTVEPQGFRFEHEGIDWIIGNHSDELSPWLPVLAARLKTSFFLLPCCPFELSGAKFHRRNTSISAYQDFLIYAREVSDQCGYETLLDRLKIPSTKRIALIGLKRNLKIPENLEDFVHYELQKHQTGEENAKPDIKLREKEESVRNCTQVDKNILDLLAYKIFMLLLSQQEIKDDTWQQGGKLSIRDIALSLTREELGGIKSECGGVKTLLRNKHEVFEFCGNDLIGIRRPKSLEGVLSTAKSQTIRKRVCFFKQFHPQGCPLEAKDCSFIH